MTEYFVPVALVTGAVSSVLWAYVLARHLVRWHRGRERRTTYVVMAGAALLASIGGLASALGIAQQTQSIPTSIPTELLSFVASVGRGALVAAALIVLTHDRKPKERGA